MQNLKKYNTLKYIIITISCLSFLLLEILVLTNIINSNNKTSTSICIFAGFIMPFIPVVLEMLFKLKFTLIFYMCFLLFCFFSMGVGTVCGVYNSIPIYDFIIHLISGVIITFFAYGVFAQVVNSNFSLTKKILLALFFAISFTALCSVIWEIYEFTFDTISGGNSQRFMGLVGQEALKDTMEDYIASFIGSIISSITLISYNFATKKEPQNFLYLNK